jgi:hypothetical protein
VSRLNRTKKAYIRDIVRQRAGGLCELCGTETDPTLLQCAPLFPTMHHRFPHRRGGRDEVDNLLLLCHHCHQDRVHADEERAQAYGWMCTSDYADQPVLCRKGWVWLMEDGTYEPLPWHEAEALTREHVRSKKQSVA